MEIPETTENPLQELETWRVRAGRPPLHYSATNCDSGVRVVVFSGTRQLGIGEGKTKREAKQQAARNILSNVTPSETRTYTPKQTPSYPRKNRAQNQQSHKTERGSNTGRFFEDVMERVLEDLRTKGEIDDFERHAPFSEPDMMGIDFSVTKDGVTCHFGMTISHKSWLGDRLTYLGIPQFWIPKNMKPDSMARRVLELFRPLK